MKINNCLTAVASALVFCGCLSNKLTVNGLVASGSGTFGLATSDRQSNDDYKSNLGKLKSYGGGAHNWQELSQGDYVVCTPDLSDDRHPLKMVVYYSDNESWNLIAYFLENGAITATHYQTLGKPEEKLRKYLLKYLKESDNHECVAWRSWATTTVYEKLSEKPPTTSLSGFGQFYLKGLGFTMGARDPRFTKYAMSGRMLDTLTREGFIHCSGLPVSDYLSNDDRAGVAFTEPMYALAKNAERGQGRQFDILNEINGDIVKKRMAKKSAIDEERRIAEEKARKERERAAAETLRKNRELDAATLARFDEEITAWKRSQEGAIAKVLSSTDPVAAFVAFAKTNKPPHLEHPDEVLKLSESKSKAETASKLWRQFEKINLSAINSDDSRRRAEAIYGLADYCNSLNGELWDAIRKHCENQEKARFDKKFEVRDSSCPGRLWATVVSGPLSSGIRELIICGERYYFYKPMHDEFHIIAKKQSAIDEGADKKTQETEVGQKSEDIPLESLFDCQYGPANGDLDNLKSIFGVSFGAVMKKDIKPTGTTADGFLVYRFTPKKQFREFKEYTITATPISRRIFKVSAREISSKLMEYSNVLTLLESKYKRKSVEMLGQKCIVFSDGNGIWKSKKKRFIAVSGSDDEVTIGIEAFDGALHELGKEEVKKTLLQKSSSDIDAL